MWVFLSWAICITAVSIYSIVMKAEETEQIAQLRILNDTITNHNSSVFDSDAEFFTPEPYFKIPRRNIAFTFPLSFPFAVHNTTFINLANFHGQHCVYDVEYIINSGPPTFHKFCKHEKSMLGWRGFCLQTFAYKRDIIRGIENSTTFVFDDCIFIPTDIKSWDVTDADP